ncbi:hypothetical protein [Paenibacillus gansuensis]|uniref:Transposase n=1 Tax=Paenibacillus gansuensis TaxID=306542 RepID=A0ABW5PAM0_9BACL
MTKLDVEVIHMLWLIYAMAIVIPAAFLLLRAMWKPAAAWLHYLAAASLYTAGVIAAGTVYDILQHHEVFMTTVHRIFLNPLFLGAAGYLGVYAIHLLLWSGWTAGKKRI